MPQTDTAHFSVFAAWIDGEMVSVNAAAGFESTMHALPISWHHISRPDYWRGERNSGLQELDPV